MSCERLTTEDTFLLESSLIDFQGSKGAGSITYARLSHVAHILALFTGRRKNALIRQCKKFRVRMSAPQCQPKAEGEKPRTTRRRRRGRRRRRNKRCTESRGKFVIAMQCTNDKKQETAMLLFRNPRWTTRLDIGRQKPTTNPHD